jgi:TetR/AcrR family transcriptional regulator
VIEAARVGTEPASRGEAILAGAARAFAENGWAATSMREVATATGASLGSIYHHFESKEDLLRAILCSNFRRVAESLEERLAKVTDPREALVATVANHVAFFARHLDEMRVMSHELDTLTGEAGAEVAALRRAYAARVTGLLGQLRPDLGSGDLRVASLCLFGMVNWTYRWFHTLPSEVDAERLGRRMAALFLDGFADRSPKTAG